MDLKTSSTIGLMRTMLSKDHDFSADDLNFLLSFMNKDPIFAL